MIGPSWTWEKGFDPSAQGFPGGSWQDLQAYKQQQQPMQQGLAISPTPAASPLNTNPQNPNGFFEDLGKGIRDVGATFGPLIGAGIGAAFGAPQIGASIGGMAGGIFKQMQEKEAAQKAEAAQLQALQEQRKQMEAEQARIAELQKQAALQKQQVPSLPPMPGAGQIDPTTLQQLLGMFGQNGGQGSSQTDTNSAFDYLKWLSPGFGLLHTFSTKV